MPLKRSRCFVLRTYPVRETDLVAVLFSGEEGKARAWVNGARHPRSRYGGAFGVGNEIEAGWREREGRELVTVDHCALVTSALPLARAPLRAATIGYAAALLDALTGDREPSEALYRLTARCRDALLAGADPRRVALYFEAWSLRLSGLYPRPGVCPCGRDLAATGAAYRAAGPEFRCFDCAGGREADARLPPAGIALIRSIWSRPPEEVASTNRGARDDAGERVFHFHGAVVLRAVERPIPARALLEGTLAAKTGPSVARPYSAPDAAAGLRAAEPRFAPAIGGASRTTRARMTGPADPSLE